MTRSIRPGVHVLVALSVLMALPRPAVADEMWIAPTLQRDTGGLGIGSNVVWPVTVAGASRFAWGVPDDLQTFQGAKIVLIPHAPGGAATLNVIVCAAQNGQPVAGTCTGPSPHAFTGVANQLSEVDISADLAPKVGAAGLNNLAVVAFTTPTDHLAGLRFVYTAKLPAGVATLGANTFSGTQTAPMFVGDGTNVSNVNANLLDGLDSTAFALSSHGHDVSQITNAARLAGGNTFTGTQVVDGGNIDLDPSTGTTGNITKNGARFLHNFGNDNTFVGVDAGNFTMTSYGQNTAVGVRALRINTTGEGNTAMGWQALFTNTTGNGNTAIGRQTLTNDTTGFQNTAIGDSALFNNTDGDNNTASGERALYSNTTGEGNTGVGAAALNSNTAGLYNTAVGFLALQNNTAGTSNVAVGQYPGVNATTGSSNIYLGANVAGAAGESNTMYLGLQGTQTRTFIAGVRGVTTGNANAVPVVIDSNGQLGTVNSSRRFKEDIRDMGDASRRLYDLRPVTFRYTQAYTDGSKPINYGLIAEDVADVFPELATRGADGAIETVHYETLNVLLLNELQAQQRRIEKLEQQLEALLRATAK